MPLTTKTGNSYIQKDVTLSDDLQDIPLSISFDFDALSEDDISVCAINRGSSTKLDYTLTTDFTVDFANKTVTCVRPSWQTWGAFSMGANSVRVFRTTTTEELVDFTNGAVISENDLDNAYKQSLFAAQEMTEDAAFTSAGVQSVGSGVIESGAVTSDKIAGQAVTNAKLGLNAVTTDRINDAAVTDAKLATDAVTTAKILNDAVTVDKLADDAVDTDQLADDAVTYDKVEVASTAEMEGQSAAGVVTPDVLKHSPLAPKCYGTVTYDGNAPTVIGDFNVASVAENTDYERTITFANALDNAEYTVLLTQQYNAAAASRYPFVKTKSSTGFTIRAYGGDASGHSLNFVVFGSTYA